SGPAHPVDEAGALLWAITAYRPLDRRNARLAVLAADLHLATTGLALVTDDAPAVRKLLSGIAEHRVDLDETTAWIRDHFALRERTHRMFERFTDRARQALSLAHDEATALQHGFLGTEHLLLGLLAEGTGIAAVVLTDLGLTLDGARDAVREMVGPMPDY